MENLRNWMSSWSMPARKTDTDTLLLESQTEDRYKNMAQDHALYDTADYQKEHPGKMKDECAGQPITEYVSLRSKMYSILEASGNNIRKAKGISIKVCHKEVHSPQAVS